ncbi:uncharacterized protein JCM6883_000399 [Sporobolomyces salmoneus]|uniref:uncharacterized protein n=1 Tax=Sporobolomyces salmoneus TaxID=183962 RepID=UPI00317FF26A
MLGWSTQIGNKLFGQDPKLEFRKPGQGADLLARSRTIPLDDPYWNQYLTLLDSPSDVIYLLPTSILLKTLEQNPQNLISLLSFTTNHLFRSLKGTSTSARRDGWNKEVLNCVRVLTRLIPLLLGPRNGGTDQVEEELFWKKQRTPVQRRKQSSTESGQKEPEEEEQGQFVLEDEDEEDDERDPLTNAAASTSTPARAQESTREEEGYEESPCLAERLIASLINLLFVPGLTLSPDLGSSNDSLVTYSIWEPGIASPFPSTPSPSTPNYLLSNRFEILRLLTLLISLPSLLTPPHLYPSIPNQFRQSLVTGQALKNSSSTGQRGEGNEKNVILCLLCSLINTACAAGRDDSKNSTASSSGGGGTDEGIGGGFRASAARLAAEAAKRTQDVALGTVGVNGSSTSGLGGGGGGEDVRDLLVGNCLQFLGNVLIDHALTSDDSATAAAKEINLFEFYLSKLHRKEDFDFLLSGLLSHIYNALLPPSSSFLPIPIPFSILKNPLDSLNNPDIGGGNGGKLKSSGWTTEALTVLWRLVEKNKKFCQWLIREKGDGGSGKWGEVVALLEIVRNEWRGDETQIGLVRLSSFLIQTLTAETAILASTSDQHSISLKQVLNNPIEQGSSNRKLRELVRRQCASHGIGGGGEDGSSTVTLIEFLITSAHSLILSPSTNKSGRLSTLYPSIILSIDNLSPYIVELSGDASTRLVRIWLAFSAPSWVLMEEGNPRLIYYLLETFNNILYHNLSLNSRFVYALLQTHKRFELLSQFTLELGVSEARRLRAERRKKQLQQSSSNLESVKEGEVSTTTSPSRISTMPSASPRLSVSSVTSGGPLSPARSRNSSFGTLEEEVQVSEKAAGKRRERSLSSTLGTFNMSELSLNESVMTTTTSEEGQFVGKNGFVPTESWVSSWREGLPLDPILILISELLPQISDCPTRTTALDVILSSSPQILPFLPPCPTPPKPRRFLLSPPLQTWLASTLYGKIYLSHLDFLREVVPVQLFAIQQAPNSSGMMRRRTSGGLGLERTVEGVGEFARGVLGRVGGGAR